IHALIQNQAGRTPDTVAIEHRDMAMSFGELDRRSNRVARELIKAGVGAEVLVGLALSRTADAVVCILAVLKTGGAYLPLDINSPAERIRYILEDSQAMFVVTGSDVTDALNEVRASVVTVDPGAPALDPDDRPLDLCEGAELAYVIYTSGSTGKPKGVAIGHDNALAMIDWACSAYQEYELTSVLASTSLCFDLSIYEIFVPLSRGGKVVLVDSAVELIMGGFPAGLTLINTVPSVIKELLDHQKLPVSVRVVNVAGEALQAAEVETLYGKTAVRRVVNLYGPTECTTYSTSSEILNQPAADVTIGRPITNTRLYVLNDSHTLLPVPAPGELYIGGEGVARCYVNNADLTSERFLPDPYSPRPGLRMYRTGDVVRYRADGRVDFLGRSDNQVKIRGYRIELGEIEAELSRAGEIEQAAVMAVPEPGGANALVAYIVEKEGSPIGAAELRNRLAKRLPGYMIPARIVKVDRMPVNSNGKIDRRRLPLMATREGVLTPDRVKPRTQIEEMLVVIWCQLLGVAQVGVTDNFFEIGGHSLLATQVMNRVQRALGVDIGLRAIFECETIERLAARIESALKTGGYQDPPRLVRASRNDGHLPLSFSQQRLWFLDQLEPDNPFYNLANRTVLTSDLNVAALEIGITEVVRRHEALRTVFPHEENGPHQVVKFPERLVLPQVDLSELGIDEVKTRAPIMVAMEEQRPFNLAQGPLVRPLLVRLTPAHSLLVFTMHHVIGDAWSTRILRDEIVTLYQSSSRGVPSPLPELELQYPDYAVWQREWLRGEVLERQVGYWRNHLLNAPAVLLLPADRPRPTVQRYVGASLNFSLGKTLSLSLNELSRNESATLFMTLLCGFGMLLDRCTGDHDIIIGTPIAGRNHIELEPIVGFFVNSLVMRLNLDGGMTVAETLKTTRGVALAAYAHQDVPFEKLVDELKVERSLSHNPLFQVMFSMPNIPGDQMEFGAGDFRAEERQAGPVIFDLTLMLQQSASGEIGGALEYSADLFDAVTIQRLSTRLRTVFEKMVECRETRISGLSLLSPNESNEILVTWNATSRDYDRTGLVHQQLERRVQERPDA
ncbi:MAG TPA: amino acid adenylation domain-containing protein, partial [Blastocatellia bacterium]|nr:amino acid adenylation domain-containing protein [Blastocatellia bacterium]